MIHINKFGIGNFRVFKEMQEFTFASITILTGTNSSGKSSLTKAMMLLKESMINSKLSKIEFNNSSLKLGSLENNLNFESKENGLNFEIEYTNKVYLYSDEYKRTHISGDDNIYRLNLKYNKSIISEINYFENNVNFITAIYGKSEHGIDLGRCTHFNKWNIKIKSIVYTTLIKQISKLLNENELTQFKHNIENYIQTSYSTDGSIFYHHADLFDLQRDIRDLTSLFDDFRLFKKNGEMSQRLAFLEPWVYTHKIEKILDKEITSKLNKDYLKLCIQDFVSAVTFNFIDEELIYNKLNDIYYIPGVRMNQEIVFKFSEYPNITDIIDIFQTEIIYKDDYDGKYNFLKKWLVDEFKIVTQVENLEFGLIEGYGFSVNISRERSLYQLGYGITQLLPIILQVAFLKNSVFIIEEPESNLHPALQSKLADFFIEASKTYNIQFIIETHSEYLIRKMQYLTAKKEIKPEDTQIYYFYPPNEVPEGERQVYPINIQEDGSLTKNFGKGFFDEAGNLDLLLYQMTKTRNN